MIKPFRAMFAIVLVCGIASPVVGIRIPMEYRKNFDYRGLKLNVGAVRVADHDMLSPGAEPAPIYIDFTTSEAEGLILVNDTGTTTSEVGGRKCRVALNGSTFGINLDEKLTTAVNSSDVYVLVDYFDESTTDGQLRVGYGAANSSGSGLTAATEETTITNTRTWKTHQFRLQRTAFGVHDKRHWDLGIFVVPQATFTAHGYASLKAKQETPPGNFKVPPLVGENPFYLEIKLGDKTRLAAVDRQTSGDAFFNRIRFDENGNSDLTDDPAIIGEIRVMESGRYRRAEFPEVDTEVDVNGQKLPYRFTVEMYSFSQPVSSMARMPFEYRVQCSLRSCGYYTGQVDLNGRKYRLALGDSNCNGRFDDKFAVQPGSFIMEGGEQMPYYRADTLYITESDDLAYEDGQMLGDTLILGDKVFDVSVDPSGKQLSLDETKRSLGRLTIPFPAMKMQLQTTEEPPSVIMMADIGAEFNVPVGSYRLYTYTLERKDEQGDLWRLSARGTPASSSTLVSADTPGSMVFGEPYTPSIRTQIMGNSRPRVETKQWWEFWKGSDQPASQPKIQVNLDFSLHGVGGETVTDLSHVAGTNTKIELSTQDTRRPKEPSYKIAKADGEIATQGSFSYG